MFCAMQPLCFCCNRAQRRADPRRLCSNVSIYSQPSNPPQYHHNPSLNMSQYRLNVKILIYYFGWRPEVTKLINFGIFFIFVLSIYPMQEP